MIKILQSINLALSFIIELCAVYIYGTTGFVFGGDSLIKYALLILLPAILILLWGIFAAPKSKRRLKNPARTIFKLIVFASAALFLIINRNLIFAAIFSCAVIMNFAFVKFLKMDY